MQSPKPRTGSARGRAEALVRSCLQWGAARDAKGGGPRSLQPKLRRVKSGESEHAVRGVVVAIGRVYSRAVSLVLVFL